MSSQYDLDGQLCMRVTVRRPRGPKIPLKNVAAVNWCTFRGMLMKSSIYFTDKAEVAVAPFAKAEIVVGDHPRMAPLHTLDIADKPLFTACLPHSAGVLDDHMEAWFITSDEAGDPENPPEGLESVIGLPRSEEWLAPPTSAGRVPGADR